MATAVRGCGRTRGGLLRLLLRLLRLSVAATRDRAVDCACLSAGGRAEAARALIAGAHRAVVRARLIARARRAAVVGLAEVVVATALRLHVPSVARAHVAARGLRNGATFVVADGATVAATAIGAVDRRRLAEVVATVVARVDAEHPRAAAPDGGLIEVHRGDITAILPRRQHEAQVGVAAVPVDAEHIVGILDAEEVVQINLIDSLILIHRQAQLVRHLVGEEQSFLPCLGKAHCLCGYDYRRQHCRHQHLLHHG